MLEKRCVVVVFRINKMKITKIEVYQADLPLVSIQVALGSKVVCIMRTKGGVEDGEY